MSVQSSLLMTSVLAVAANHLGFQDPRYSAIAFQYKGSTLKSLRRILTADWRTTSESELLGTILMLCFLEISDQCHPNWMAHLDGANAIIGRPSITQDTYSDPILSCFIAPYFAAHNIMAYTAVANPALEPRLLEGGRHWLSKINRPCQEIDCIIGCSKELLSIILETSLQIRRLKKNTSPCKLRQARAWKDTTERKLGNLKQEIPGDWSSEQPPSSFHSVIAAWNTAEAFRHATVLLLQYLDDQDSCHESTIQSCVHTILELVKQCPIHEHGARSSSFWPFFIAACHSTREQDRVYVLNRFRALERPKRFGNIRPARKVIEHVWKQRDLRADDTDQERCGVRCFEWEDAMAQLGSNISLT